MMIWFDGSIPDAINLAKQRNRIFVIVIIGEDEQSTNLVSSWEDDNVSEMAKKCCVAIKVDAKSDTCVQFSQIYPVVCIPSSFFIGENGIPLEVVAGSVSAAELQIRIDKVQQMHGQKIGPDMVSQETSATVMISPTQPAMAALSAPAVPFISPEDDMSSSAVEDVEPREPTKAAGGRQSTKTIAASGHSDRTSLCFTSEENLDVQRFNMEPDERHQQKTTLKDEEIKKPKEQQKMAKDMHDFKREQEEEKTKRLLEERNREKVLDKVARERVKQQIAMDRVDRAASYSKSLEEKAQQVKLQAELEAIKGTFARPRSNITRLQFRLPDGSTFTNQFSSHSRLQEAQHFVIQEIGSRYGNLSMATMFPRREFTSEDLNKTLLELQLAPSSSIVLLPCGTPASTVVPSTRGGTWAVLNTLLYPVLTIWRFLCSFMFPSPPQETSRGSLPLSQSYTNSATRSDKSNRESLSRPFENRPKNFKKDGKICQLRSQEDSEDDNSTWNGNSTQQM
ncbi:UBX domain-containing protein 4 isoform X2 [Phycodurus eques]|uniref:UBX domain-containing protein 4 isoform X2 n=1 Tax=Phycodurus eques TaxID=693459 RepID=UPI002ACE3023|nr:UBX domain-containing protein 4 isoform X2 [Phycodurus eques]